jgi:hypothetical protein
MLRCLFGPVPGATAFADQTFKSEFLGSAEKLSYVFSGTSIRGLITAEPERTLTPSFFFCGGLLRRHKFWRLVKR